MGSALNSQPPPFPPEVLNAEPPIPPSDGFIKRPRPIAPTPPPEQGNFTQGRLMGAPDTSTNPIDVVRDPNFNFMMQNQDYFNMISQLLAERQARGPERNLMPIGETAERLGMQQRTPTLEELKALRKIPAPAPIPEQGTPGAVPPSQERLKELEIFNKLRRGEILTPEEQIINIRLQQSTRPPIPPMEFEQPIQQINQMDAYNQMLQQGMRRNQDMNQAAQNFAAPAGPARSFSQGARTPRTPRGMRRMPRQPSNNSLAPNNQRLI